MCICQALLICVPPPPLVLQLRLAPRGVRGSGDDLRRRCVGGHECLVVHPSYTTYYYAWGSCMPADAGCGLGCAGMSRRPKRQSRTYPRSRQGWTRRWVGGVVLLYYREV